MVRQEGGVSGKVISSPSSKTQSLPTEKNHPWLRSLNSCLKSNSTVCTEQ